MAACEIKLTVVLSCNGVVQSCLATLRLLLLLRWNADQDVEPSYLGTIGVHDGYREKISNFHFCTNSSVEFMPKPPFRSHNGRQNIWWSRVVVELQKAAP
jgi:hypothetical protein